MVITTGIILISIFLSSFFSITNSSADSCPTRDLSCGAVSFCSTSLLPLPARPPSLVSLSSSMAVDIPGVTCSEFGRHTESQQQTQSPATGRR